MTESEKLLLLDYQYDPVLRQVLADALYDEGFIIESHIQREMALKYPLHPSSKEEHIAISDTGRLMFSPFLLDFCVENCIFSIARRDRVKKFGFGCRRKVKNWCNHFVRFLGTRISRVPSGIKVIEKQIWACFGDIAQTKLADKQLYDILLSNYNTPKEVFSNTCFIPINIKNAIFAWNCALSLGGGRK